MKDALPNGGDVKIPRNVVFLYEGQNLQKSVGFFGQAKEAAGVAKSVADNANLVKNGKDVVDTAKDVANKVGNTQDLQKDVFGVVKQAADKAGVELPKVSGGRDGEGESRRNRHFSCRTHQPVQFFPLSCRAARRL